MTTLTPEQIDARIAASAAKRPAYEHINNALNLAASPASIVHINIRPGTFRALTIAYEEINKSHLKIATAVVHKSDTFRKKKGTQIALKNFSDGKTVVVPRHPNYDIAEQLREMFGYVHV